MLQRHSSGDIWEPLGIGSGHDRVSLQHRSPRKGAVRGADPAVQCPDGRVDQPSGHLVHYPNVGAISSTGLYTAPSSISQQQVTVTATSTSNNALSSTSTITLNLPVLINVIPSAVNLAASQTQGFGKRSFSTLPSRM